jgi:hypothetical protein
MRLAFVVVVLVVGLPALLVAGWVTLSRVDPGKVGTPAHAGAISNGKPEDCTTVDLSVNARSTASATVSLSDRQVMRATYEANGGFGKVDILMRIISPNNEVLLESPRAANYDFVVSARAAGDYTFVFDNRYSLITPKAIGFYYCIPNNE